MSRQHGIRVGALQQIGWQIVPHDSERAAVGLAESLDPHDGQPRGDAQSRGNLLVSLYLLHRQHLGGRLPARCSEVFIQAAQGKPALNAAVNHHRPHTALTDDKPFVREPLNGLAHGRAADAEPLAQLHLIIETIARRKRARLDRLLEIPRDLEIERDRTRLVDWPSHNGGYRWSHALPYSFVNL